MTAETTPEKVRESWPEIRRIILEELPSDQDLLDLMTRAGAARTLEDIAVDRKLGVLGVKYHPYMRRRMTLMRLIPMLNIAVDFEKFVG